MSEARGRVVPWLLVALVLVLLDQASKWWVTSSLDYGVPVPVWRWFNLTLLHNTGAAFSFLAHADGWQRWFFAGIALAVSVWIVYMLRRSAPDARWLPVALTLVLGGALGNLWDRLALGYVVDFIHFCQGNWCFPAFNIADSAITVGAAMLVIDSFLDHRRGTTGAG